MSNAHNHIFNTLQSAIGNTPLIRMTNMVPDDSNIYLLKLEGNNPAGSVKDRPALNMILQAQQRGDIQPGDTLIEATSGNTGIALAMVSAVLGYKMVLIMPANMSKERGVTKRGHAFDVKKPEGWVGPDHTKILNTYK